MLDSRSMKVAVAVTTLAVLAACGGENGTEPNPDPTPTIAAADGNGQTGNIGEVLDNPVTVRVTEDGAALSGRSITWTVTGGGGSVDPTTSTTDAAGEASTTWTLGAAAGLNALQASLAGATGSPVVFGATGEDPFDVAVTVGDNFFNPSTRRVAAGGTVTWTWAGAVAHNVTFPAGPNSVTQAAGSFSRDFPTAGSFDYLCTIHGAAMSGTIVVE